jgi:hypothetical protein
VVHAVVASSQYAMMPVAHAECKASVISACRQAAVPAGTASGTGFGSGWQQHRQLRTRSCLLCVCTGCLVVLKPMCNISAGGCQSWCPPAAPAAAHCGATISPMHSAVCAVAVWTEFREFRPVVLLCGWQYLRMWDPCCFWQTQEPRLC